MGKPLQTGSNNQYTTNMVRAVVIDDVWIQSQFDSNSIFRLDDCGQCAAGEDKVDDALICGTAPEAPCGILCLYTTLTNLRGDE
jgi:hypothetical protein